MLWQKLRVSMFQKLIWDGSIKGNTIKLQKKIWEHVYDFEVDKELNRFNHFKQIEEP